MGSTAAHTNLKRQLAQACTAQGWLPRSNPANAMTGRGRSDLEVCAEGLFIALEVKTGGGKLSPPQRLRLQRVNSHGGLGFTARDVPSSIQAIQQWITTRGSKLSEDFEIDINALFEPAPEAIDAQLPEDLNEAKQAVLEEATRTLTPPPPVVQTMTTSSSSQTQMEETLQLVRQMHQTVTDIYATQRALHERLVAQGVPVAPLQEVPPAPEVPAPASTSDAPFDVGSLFPSEETSTPEPPAKPATRRRSPK